MKKIIALAAIAASSSVFAQASNFTGWSAGLNVDMVHTSMDTKELTDSSAGTTTKGIGNSSTGASLQAAYGFAMDPKWVLGVGATYRLNDDKIMDSTDISNGSVTKTTSFKLKNAASVYFEPGYLVNNNTLAYGKISYEEGKAYASGVNGTPWTFSKSLKGTGFGFGIRTMLDKNMYLQAEVKQVTYSGVNDPSNETEFKTKSTVGSIGIGYKF